MSAISAATRSARAGAALSSRDGTVCRLSARAATGAAVGAGSVAAGADVGSFGGAAWGGSWDGRAGLWTTREGRVRAAAGAVGGGRSARHATVVPPTAPETATANTSPAFSETTDAPLATTFTTAGDADATADAPSGAATADDPAATTPSAPAAPNNCWSSARTCAVLGPRAAACRKPSPRGDPGATTSRRRGGCARPQLIAATFHRERADGRRLSCAPPAASSRQ